MPGRDIRPCDSPKPSTWRGSQRLSARSGTPTTTPPPRLSSAVQNEAVATGSPFRTGPLRHLADVEELTMNYVHWYNNNRLHSELDHLTPEEYEQTFYALPTGSPTGDAANKKTA